MKNFNRAFNYAEKNSVLDAVAYDPSNLQYAVPQLQADKDVVLAAVRKNGRMLRFAAPKLQDDKEVVITAILQDGHAFSGASRRLFHDEELILIAAKTNKSALGDVLQTSCTFEELTGSLSYERYYSFRNLIIKGLAINPESFNFLPWVFRKEIKLDSSIYEEVRKLRLEF